MFILFLKNYIINSSVHCIARYLNGTMPTVGSKSRCQRYPDYKSARTTSCKLQQ